MITVLKYCLIYHSPVFPQNIHFSGLVFHWLKRINMLLIQVDSNKISFYLIHWFDLVQRFKWIIEVMLTGHFRVTFFFICMALVHYTNHDRLWYIALWKNKNSKKQIKFIFCSYYTYSIWTREPNCEEGFYSTITQEPRLIESL